MQIRGGTGSEEGTQDRLISSSPAFRRPHSQASSSLAPIRSPASGQTQTSPPYASSCHHPVQSHQRFLSTFPVSGTVLTTRAKIMNFIISGAQGHQAMSSSRRGDRAQSRDRGTSPPFALRMSHSNALHLLWMGPLSSSLWAWGISHPKSLHRVYRRTRGQPGPPVILLPDLQARESACA